ncbi:hypothetical protein HK097_010190 [Rhizophlyctis rosea]|uniref:Uncharacterized protein n=1 Tax=Rhizophlyctis rosea TaxID=64517 RepID=A0AAD5X2Q6_9FUNG|nr:hypothetical protein HK097_010190 [Rhizophlyctis rosea]
MGYSNFYPLIAKVKVVEGRMRCGNYVLQLGSVMSILDSKGNHVLETGDPEETYSIIGSITGKTLGLVPWDVRVSQIGAVCKVLEEFNEIQKGLGEDQLTVEDLYPDIGKRWDEYVERDHPRSRQPPDPYALEPHPGASEASIAVA